MSSDNSQRLLIVVNDPAFFLSHRLPVALAAKNAGWDVHVTTGPGDRADTIQRQGLTYHLLPLTRSGLSPKDELRTFVAMWRLFRRLQPNVIHLVTAKPVLYGGLAARLARAPAVVFAISGLGFFVETVSTRSRLLSAVGRWLYRRAFEHPRARVIVQHLEDQERLRAIGALRHGQATLIPGSGVDLARFESAAPPDEPPLVVLPARMLVEKGVRVFAEAAVELRRRGNGARFALVGDVDAGNPGSLAESELTALTADGALEWWGQRDDIPDILARSSIVCLPSFYGEGIPKTLIEAAAAGRAVVTTDWPGCRDAIIPDETGLLVPPRDAIALADALETLLRDPARRAQLGAQGRRLAEQRYSIESVVDAHLAIYEELIGER